MPIMRRYTALLVLLTIAAAAPPARADGLVEARAAYNNGDYDAAIAAARAALVDPKSATEARVVLGRALVERYRQSASPEDLADARVALLEAATAPLPQPLRTEWLVGSAETLFFEEQFGAAAVMFGGLLEDPRVDALIPGGRDRLLDWWATAADRALQPAAGSPRTAEYERLAHRLEQELARDAALGAAAYWRVVALRGAGHLDAAWDAALAAWVGAPLARDRGAQLRADLERVVAQALIPERARRAGRDADKQTAILRDQWQAFKERWTSK